MAARVERQRETAHILALAMNAPNKIDELLRPAPRRTGASGRWWKRG